MIISYRGDLLYDFPPEILKKNAKLAQRFADLTRRKMLGYWGPTDKMIVVAHKNKGEDWSTYLKQDLPNPRDYIDNSWDSVERDQVANYLDTGREVAKWMGYSECRICSYLTGFADLQDDEYIWPSGFSHYLRAHNVKPPTEFLEHVRRKLGLLV